VIRRRGRALARGPAWSLGCAVVLLALASGASSASTAVTSAGHLPAGWDEQAPPGVEVLAGSIGRAPARGPAPLWIRIPAIRLDARVAPVGVDGRAVELPARPDRVGWFRPGAAPGDPRGTAVLLAHVRTRSGPGPFASLRRLGPGDDVRVARVDGSVARFTVMARRRYDKDELPSSRLFTQDTGAALVLITCGGPVQGRHYRDNVVVVAQPASQSPVSG
jgi:hypothetical protein